MMSSLMPSEKYSCSGSPLMLANGRTQMDRRRGSRPGVFTIDMLGRTHGEGTYRALDVFRRVLAQVLERARELPRHLVAHRERYRDAAHRRERLQPRGDVDAFAIDVVAFDDDLAEIDADPIADALCFGALGFGARRRLLDRESAANGGDDASELDERAVAHEFDQAPAVCRNAGIKNLASVDLQPFMRPGLVALRQNAIAGDVRRKYRGQSALHRSEFESSLLSIHVSPQLRAMHGCQQSPSIDFVEVSSVGMPSRVSRCSHWRTS